ncbi:MAG: radical SAM family heme chaperone HemW [Gillisia sp.]
MLKYMLSNQKKTVVHNLHSSPLGRVGGAIYLHIPFCKQACHYCDFHFSTSVKKKGELVEMLCKELELRKDEFSETMVECIYFGGGTPSLLSEEDLKKIFITIYGNFEISEDPEITLEANPDDLSEEKLSIFKEAGINRLSIGVQSFFQEDLEMMNRAHNAEEAAKSIVLAKEFFDNISIDLIYGIPGMTEKRWQENIQKALDFELPHFSCYALTVEPNTALKKFIEKRKIKPVDDEMAKRHFEILVDKLQQEGFIHYEFSNFGKPGYFSRNNTAYWTGKPYLGIGPSAHSFNGVLRRWNLSNNSLYIKKIFENILPFEEEELSESDKYNEYVMTRLRTMWGISLEEVKKSFADKYYQNLVKEIQPFLEKGLLVKEGDTLKISSIGKFLSDGIASDLFYIE